MQPGEEIQRHPNATFVFSTTPFTTLVVWLILKMGYPLPPEVAAAIGTLISGALLVFRTAITGAGHAVWALGFVGCCRRIWKGAQDVQDG